MCVCVYLTDPNSFTPRVPIFFQEEVTTAKSPSKALPSIFPLSYRGFAHRRTAKVSSTEIPSMGQADSMDTIQVNPIQVADFIKTIYANPNSVYIPDKRILIFDA